MKKKYVQKQVETLSIKCAGINQYVSALSGGNKQKVVFGKWIGRGSDVLILDCPTRGVDIGVKQAMYQLMYQMKKRRKINCYHFRGINRTDRYVRPSDDYEGWKDYA